MEEQHKTYLLQLGACITSTDKLQFNVEVLKAGYNYNDKHIIDFWNKVTLIQIPNEKSGQLHSTSL